MVEEQLKSNEYAQFLYDLPLFEQTKSFCNLKLNESQFLEKFILIEEDNLFLESIQDPFKEIPSKVINKSPPGKAISVNRLLFINSSWMNSSKNSISNNYYNAHKKPICWAEELPNSKPEIQFNKDGKFFQSSKFQRSLFKWKRKINCWNRP